MKEKKLINKLEWNEILKFLKDYGFIIESAKLYGGLKSAYDYGPLGTKIKDEIKQLWKEQFVDQEKLVHFIEGTILTQPKVLEASGHLQKFEDLKLTCPYCQRVEFFQKIYPEIDIKKINSANKKWKAFCQTCQSDVDWKQSKQSLLFKTKQGTTAETDKTLDKQNIFLRPETAQTSFLNFIKVVQSLKLTLPFGLAQIGKVFRNEITTEYANFRTCEFEQMEVEFFFAEKNQKDHWFNYWKEKTLTFLKDKLKINPQHLRTRVHLEEELAHYATKTIDFEYQFPFGWKEIWGLTDRDQYDLKAHQKSNQEELTILNKKQEKILPFVVEPSAGVERLMLTLLVDKLTKVNNKWVMKLPKQFCYYQIAILPLTEKLTADANKLYQQLAKTNWRIRFDSKGSIGKRYVFHDAIGTYFCLTFDFQSLTDQKVTVRFRDTQKQDRIAINQLTDYFNKHFQND